jgi:hypothetical protein
MLVAPPRDAAVEGDDLVMVMGMTGHDQHVSDQPEMGREMGRSEVRRRLPLKKK